MKKYIFLIALSPFSTCFGMESDDTCDITGLNKGAVLQALLQSAKSNNTNELITPDFSVQSCRKKIEARPSKYIGTIGSRTIDIHFDKDIIDVSSYNTNNGAGAAQKAIEKLRPQSKL